MANYELSGKLFEKFPTQQVTDKFRKRELVIEVTENNYTQHIKLQLTKERCDILDKFNIGDEVKATININGRRNEKDGKVSYWNSLDIWRLELVSATNTSASEEEQYKYTDQGQDDKELPF